MHRGVDFAALKGTPVFAGGNGTDIARKSAPSGPHTSNGRSVLFAACDAQFSRSANKIYVFWGLGSRLLSICTSAPSRRCPADTFFIIYRGITVLLP